MAQSFGTPLYIKYIAQSESIDLVRKYKRKRTLPLPLNAEGELYEGNAVIGATQETQNPEDRLEWGEALSACMTKLESGLQVLPPRQRHALICSLKDRCMDMQQFQNLCTRCGIDIEAVHWPEDKSELHRLRVSLSIARRKLRVLVSESSPLSGHSSSFNARVRRIRHGPGK